MNDLGGSFKGEGKSSTVSDLLSIPALSPLFMKALELTFYPRFRPLMQSSRKSRSSVVKP